jgi:hypothetical protein
VTFWSDEEDASAELINAENAEFLSRYSEMRRI